MSRTRSEVDARKRRNPAVNSECENGHSCFTCAANLDFPVPSIIHIEFVQHRLAEIYTANACQLQQV